MKRRNVWITAALLGGLVVTVFGGTLISGPADARPWRGLGGHGHCEGEDCGIDRERLRHHVDWFLRGVDASDEQVDAIAEITARTMEGFAQSQEAREARHAAIRDALTAETVDADALEALRTTALEGLETKSEDFVGAVVEAASVLRAEQRQELAEDLGRFRDRRGWWMRH